jgi:hypothetical protein
MPIATAIIFILTLVYIFLLAVRQAGKRLKTLWAQTAAKQKLAFGFAPRGHGTGRGRNA